MKTLVIPKGIKKQRLIPWRLILAYNILFLLFLPIKGKTITVDHSPINFADSDYFVTTWETTIPDESITIPTTGDGYDYEIDWGDGTVETNQTGDATHIYDSPGIYIVRIAGNFPRIFFNNTGDKEKILTIEQWGSIQWASMERAFQGCINLNITNPNIDTPDLSTVTSLARMFNSARAFNGNIENWEVGNVVDMSFMFVGALSFNQDIGGWDVSNVVDMSSMFVGAITFNKYIGDWNVGRVENMSGMFNAARAFNQNIGNWNVSNVQDMIQMFAEASVFDQNLGNWNIGNVTDMGGIFEGVGLSLSNYDALLMGWSTQNVQPGVRFDAGNSQYCTGEAARTILTSSPNNWVITDGGPAGSICNTPDSDYFVTTWETTIENETITIPTTGTGYNYLIDWGDGIVEVGQTGDATHTYATAGIHTIRIAGDFPRIYFLDGDDRDKILTIEQWGSIQWASMEEAFAGCTNLTITNLNIDTPDLSNVRSLAGMFLEAASFNGVIGNWDVSNVVNTEDMFFNASAFNQSLSRWNVGQVTNMASMFENAVAFDQDIGNWNVENVTDMFAMFSGARLSPQNYDALLIGWSRQNLQSGIRFDAGNSQFCSGGDARDILTGSPNNWDINDRGQASGEACACVFDNEPPMVFCPDDGPEIIRITFPETFYEVRDSEYDLPVQDNCELASFTNNVTGSSTLAGVQFPLGRHEVIWTATDLAGNQTTCTFEFLVQYEERSYFIFTWNIPTDNYQIPLPASSENSTYVVDWGDGTIDTGLSNQTSHTYAESGIYTVRIAAEFLRINFGSSRYADLVRTIEQWGNIKWTSMEDAFNGCVDLEITNLNIDTPDLSLVTNMALMFSFTDKFNYNISDWDVSNVTNMSNMFSFTKAFNQNLSDWNTANVENMSSMFRRATAFDQSLANWAIFNVENMTDMFLETSLSTENYDATLISWSQQNVQSGITFNAGSSQYCAGAEARDILTSSPNNWNIIDRGVANPTCILPDSVYFVTTWRTTVPNESIRIPTAGDGYDYVIDWGDGTVESKQTGFPSHSYATPGVYTVRIAGDFPRIFFALPGEDRFKILTIEQWGDIQWTSMNVAFNNCVNLNITNPNIDAPDLSNVNDLSFMFAGASSFNGFIGNWDVSNVVTMQGMFSRAPKFNQDIGDWNVENVIDMSEMFAFPREPGVFNQDIGGWNVSKVINMGDMFAGAEAFNQDIGNWNVGEVTVMSRMFKGASSFNKDIGGWNVNKVLSMGEMFAGAEAFNQDINDWNVGQVGNMTGMFKGASSFNQDISRWDVSNLVNMISMLEEATSFDQDISNWNIESIASMERMFAGVTLSPDNYDALLIGWSAQDVQSGVPFDGGGSQYCAGAAARDILTASPNNWTITDGGLANLDGCDCFVENEPPVFTSCPGNTREGIVFEITFPATSLVVDATTWDATATDNCELASLTNNVTGTSSLVGAQFDLGRDQITWTATDLAGNTTICSAFIEVQYPEEDYFVTTWETVNPDETITIPTIGDGYNYVIDWGNGNVRAGNTGNTSRTFRNPGIHTIRIIGDFPRIYFRFAESRNKILTIEQWGNIQWQSMSRAFEGCSQLNITNQNIDAPDLSNVTEFNNTFQDATAFNGPIGNWDMSNADLLLGMFWGAESFNQDISGWNVSNATNMGIMFRDAKAFNQDIGSWNVEKVTDMRSMFQGATAFNKNIGNWKTGNVTTMNSMFANAASFNQDIGNWDVSKVMNMASMFSEATIFNKYIGDWDVGEVRTIADMFEGATAFNQNIGNWNLNKVTALDRAFKGATAFDQNIGNWNVSNVFSAFGMFEGTALSTANYDALLIGWSAQTVQPNVDFSAGGSQYCIGANARAILTSSPNSWMISDRGPSDICPPVALCQDITVEVDTRGNVSILPEQVDMGSSSPLGEVTLDLDVRDFNCVNLGENTVTLTVTDINDVSATCMATVTVTVDNSQIGTATVGGDQIVCDEVSLPLGGSDPLEGIGTWFGPDGVTFLPDANTPNAVATGLPAGTSTLTWLINGRVCEAERNTASLVVTRTAITGIVAGAQTACNPENNTYTQTLEIAFEGEPSGGMLSVNDQVFALESSPQTVILTGLVSDGNAVDVEVSFTNNTDCMFTQNDVFTAPDDCSIPCEILNVTAGDPYNCDPVSDTYSRDLIVEYQGTNLSGELAVDLNGEFFRRYPYNAQSPQTLTLEGLPSNNDWVNVRIYFSTESGCEWEAEQLFQNPQNCGSDPGGDCDISSLVVGEQSCDFDNGTYTQDLIITYTDAPRNGRILVKANNQNGWERFPITGSPQVVTLEGRTPGEGDVDIFVRFSDDNGCTFSANNLFTAPEECVLPCSITAIATGTQTACDPNTNTYSQELMVMYENEPTTGSLVVGGQVFGITGSPQTVTLTNLPADGNRVNVLAYFSEKPECEVFEDDLFTAPEACTTPPSGDGTVLFVVKNKNNLSTGDQLVKAQLENTGYTVVVKGQGPAKTADAEGKALVLISNTVSSGAVNTKFTNVAVPVVCYESLLFDDLGMTGSNNGSDYGQDSNEQTMDIDNASHPMAAGFSGEPQVYTSNGDITWGKPNDNAIKVASTQGGAQNQWSIFGYETGSSMVNGVAPARRASLFFKVNQVSKLNANGWALFDAVICWATGCQNARFAPEVSSIPPVKAYPNPFLNNLTIEWDHHAQEVQLIMRNLLGQEVLSQKVFLQGHHQLQTANLPEGMYILQVIGDDFKQEVKVVKE